MRSEKEVKSDWPEPIQPEPEVAGSGAGLWAGDEMLFSESRVAVGGTEGDKGRFVVQW